MVRSREKHSGERAAAGGYGFLLRSDDNVPKLIVVIVAQLWDRRWIVYFNWVNCIAREFYCDKADDNNNNNNKQRWPKICGLNSKKNVLFLTKKFKGRVCFWAWLIEWFPSKLKDCDSAPSLCSDMLKWRSVRKLGAPMIKEFLQLSHTARHNNIWRNKRLILSWISFWKNISQNFAVHLPAPLSVQNRALCHVLTNHRPGKGNHGN